MNLNEPPENTSEERQVREAYEEWNQEERDEAEYKKYLDDADKIVKDHVNRIRLWHVCNQIDKEKQGRRYAGEDDYIDRENGGVFSDVPDSVFLYGNSVK